VTLTHRLALATLLASGGALIGSCAATPSTSQVTTIVAPDYRAFEGNPKAPLTAPVPGVHTFLERRCGTLDCHGQVGRPFRLFSQNGLRALNDSGIVSGELSQPDTPEEVYANYLAAIGLQPEEMSRVVSGDDPPTDLLLVTKPTAMDVHKGGQVITVGDVSYVCLTTWLTLSSPATASERSANAAACAAAAAIP
jgi:hypothetical protein